MNAIPFLFNGTPADPALAGSRALQYGDGVFRTLLAWDGIVQDLERQLVRLRADAEALDLEAPDDGLLAAELSTLARAAPSAALRVTLSRANTGRGYAPDTRRCDRLLGARALAQYPASCWTQGIEVGWSPVLLGIQRRLAGIKHLNRLEQVLASRNWPAGVHEMLMCDAEGRVVCGTRSNVFFVIDNILVTPGLALAGVAGMMRGKLIELGHPRGLECEVGTIAPDEVRHASEAFVCNSLIGIWPLRRIGSLELPAPGPVTQGLIQWLDHPWRGT